MQAAMSFSRVGVSAKMGSRQNQRVLTRVSANLKQEDVIRCGQSVGLAVASFGLAFAANALTIKMGGDDGSLVFVPASATVKSGEEITWINNKGFPHNVIFDEDEVPEGVDADALSAEDYLNSAGETHTVKLSTPGSYAYYCQPHQGAGMAGKITVQ